MILKNPNIDHYIHKMYEENEEKINKMMESNKYR
jgi:hypothetical protein